MITKECHYHMEKSQRLVIDSRYHGIRKENYINIGKVQKKR